MLFRVVEMAHMSDSSSPTANSVAPLILSPASIGDSVTVVHDPGRIAHDPQLEIAGENPGGRVYDDVMLTCSQGLETCCRVETSHSKRRLHP